jgi:hypothetical protein
MDHSSYTIVFGRTNYINEETRQISSDLIYRDPPRNVVNHDGKLYFRQYPF